MASGKIGILFFLFYFALSCKSNTAKLFEILEFKPVYDRTEETLFLVNQGAELDGYNSKAVTAEIQSAVGQGPVAINMLAPYQRILTPRNSIKIKMA